MIDFTAFTQSLLEDSQDRHLPETQDPRMNEFIREVIAWRETQSLAGTACYLYGRKGFTEVAAIAFAMGMKMGWDAYGDLAEQRAACDEIGYLMSDEELEALRKEIGSK